MLNEVRQRVTTYPGTGHVVTKPGASWNCMIDHWNALNVINHALQLLRGIMEHSEETSASSKH